MRKPGPLVAAAVLGAWAAAHAWAQPPPADDAEAQLRSGLYAEAIVAGVATDRMAEVWAYPRPEPALSIRVEAVLRGDPTARTILVRKSEADLKPGDRVIVIYRGRNTIPHHTVLADTPERRAAIRSLIEKTEREWFDPQFLDREAILQAGESLLREFLQGVADRFPDHPYLGREAMKRVRSVRSDAPPGAYVRIAGNVAWHGPAYAPVLLPQGDGALVWAGFGLDRHSDYRLGHPEHLVDLSAVATVEPKPDPPAEMARPVQQEIGSRPIWVHFYGAMPDHDRKCTDIDALSAIFSSLEPKARTLSQDPPRDLDATIAFLAAYQAGLPKEPPAPASLNGPPLVASGFPVVPRLAQALRALGCPTSYLGPAPGERTFSDEQKAHLVPVLIELLMDRRIVINQTPCDGPMVACHQMAYQLLMRVTGQRLPEPLPEGPRWPEPAAYDPRRPPEVPPDPAKAWAQTLARLEAWRTWWKDRGGKPAGR